MATRRARGVLISCAAHRREVDIGLTDRVRQFRQGMKEIGYIEGESVTIAGVRTKSIGYQRW
jgi:hypothetical protein